MSAFARELAAMSARISGLERRIANAHRRGPVHQVDTAAKKVRIRIGGTDDAPFLSPWVRYAQVAGALKMHAPPSVGQQMDLLSPGGDLRQGLAVPFGWSNANPAPGATADPVMTYGDVRVEVTEGALVVKIGGTIALRLSAEQIKLHAAEILTDGTTKLNNGTREVVFKGSTDSGGDTNNQGGGSGVLV